MTLHDEMDRLAAEAAGLLAGHAAAVRNEALARLRSQVLAMLRSARPRPERDTRDAASPDGRYATFSAIAEIWGPHGPEHGPEMSQAVGLHATLSAAYAMAARHCGADVPVTPAVVASARVGMSKNKSATASRAIALPEGRTLHVTVRTDIPRGGA